MKRNENLIYGVRSVIETIQSGKHLEKIFIQKNVKGELVKELLAMIKEFSIPFSKVPVEKINRLTTKNHQGVIAFVSPVQYHSLEHVLPSVFEQGENPLFLILDRITDVRNFGAIARAAECMGVHSIVIPIKNGAQINADAIKTSAGALNYIPVCRELSLAGAIKYLKESGLRVVACSDHSKKNIDQSDFTSPLAIIMGSEEEGISQECLDLSDEQIIIPMTGHIASLNVSAASSIVLYEVSRQRNQIN